MRRPAFAPLWFGLPALLAAGACSVEHDEKTSTADAALTFQCPAHATPAVFVEEEVPPPASVAPGQSFATRITVANCSGATWDAAAAAAIDGFKLGFAAPRDATTFGPSRIALPESIPTGHKVTIDLALVAPQAGGSHEYRWAILHEGVEWLAAESPAHTVVVGGGGAPPAPTSGTVTACPGVSVDAAFGAPASAAIQECIDRTPQGGTLELPAGTYRVTGALAISRAITIRTAGIASSAPGCTSLGAPACATFRADPNLLVTRGFVRAASVSGVTFDHIVIDGDRGARLGSVAATSCSTGDTPAGNTGAGFNASFSACTDCAFIGSATIRALCGSGLEWLGDGAVVAGSTFRDNGDHDRHMMWADGLTLLRSNGSRVEGNTFVDNSDVDFICGGASNASFHHNRVEHSRQAAFAGIMLDNFADTTPGVFTGALVSNNQVSCGARLCDFGIELGPHPWYESSNIQGGTVKDNSVSGGKIGINVEGAGTPASPIVVTANTVDGSPTSATFLCGVRPTTSFNVSLDSVVDLAGGPPPTARMAFHLCP